MPRRSRKRQLRFRRLWGLQDPYRGLGLRDRGRRLTGGEEPLRTQKELASGGLRQRLPGDPAQAGFLGAADARGGRVVGMLEPERAPCARRLQGGFGVARTSLRIDQRRPGLRRNQREPCADLVALPLHRGRPFRLQDGALRVAAVEKCIREERGGTQTGRTGRILRLRVAQVDGRLLRVAAQEQCLAEELPYMCVQVGQRGTCGRERLGSSVEVAAVERCPAFDQETGRIACLHARPGGVAGLVRLSSYQQGDSLLAQASRCRNLNLPQACGEGGEAKEVPHVNI
jgi:hypothetical protein